MSAPRPSGTVTFLFTDIEDSTRLWEQHRAWMAGAAARQEAILRRAVGAHNGYAYKQIGGAFQIAFDTALEALEAAVEAQRALQAEPWGEAGPLRVRMAVHTGVTEEREDDYVGPALNRMGRLLGLSQGGQILLSEAAYELVRDLVHESIMLTDLGSHRLKDLARPEHIYQASAAGLISNFPPLKTLDLFLHNLPHQLTSFVGREKQIAHVRDLLSRERFVTLTGPGGTGKTRLALQAGAELLESFPDGVWLVELASLTDAALVPQAVAQVLQIREAADRPIFSRLSETLYSKKLLLILDNCEHLVSACARLAAGLLQACPQLHILATSREALEVAGERPLRVPSLSSPDAHHGSSSLETLTRYEAVRLFVERAAAVQPGFTLTAASAPSIAWICQRLDGIPLAIELAAARVRVMSVEQVAARLDDRFQLLTGGSRTALPRHQTLRALIDWSYDLLTREESILFERLSIFADGWTLDAAESICAGEVLDPVDVLDLLGLLVNKSLVLLDEAGRRYRLLGTIHQYAREKLSASAELDALQRRYLEYFLQLVERAEPELRGPDQVAWLNRLEVEQGNLRAALDLSLTSRIESGLRTAAALLWFWHIRGNKTAGIDRLEGLLAAEVSERGGGPLSPERAAARGRALNAIGCLIAMQGSTEKRGGSAYAEESLSIHRELGAAGKRGLAFAFWNTAEMSFQRGEFEQARAQMREGLALSRELGDPFGIAQCLGVLGSYALRENDLEAARAAWEEDLALRRELGDQDGIGYTLDQLGQLAFEEGDYERARRLYEESAAVFQNVGNRWALSIALSGLGSVALAQGRYEQAEGIYRRVLSLNRDLGDVYAVAGSLHNLARAAWYCQDYDQAAQLLTEALGHFREIGNKNVIADLLCDMGRVAWMAGDHEQASRHYRDALAIGREIAGPFLIAAALCGLGRVAASQGEPGRAESLQREALTLRCEASDRRGIVESLQALAWLAAARRQWEKAACLCGAAENLFRQVSVLLPPYERQQQAGAAAEARAALGNEQFAAARVKGKAMSMMQAVEFALQDEGR